MINWFKSDDTKKEPQGEAFVVLKFKWRKKKLNQFKSTTNELEEYLENERFNVQISSP